MKNFIDGFLETMRKPLSLVILMLCASAPLFAQQPVATPPIAASVVNPATITNDVTVQGDIASGAADSGNPAKIGCKYNLTLPTFVDGVRGDCQINAKGGVWVQTTQSAVTGSDGFSNANLGNSTSVSGATPLSTIVAPMFFNGTTWDRMRGSATQGLQVAPQPYPFGATDIIGGSGTVSNAVATATLTGVAAKFTYLSHFDITASGSTVGVCVTAQITGITGGGNFTYLFCTPAGAALGASPLSANFSPPLKSSAVNTNIVVTLPALGAGNVGAAVNANGFVQ